MEFATDMAPSDTEYRRLEDFSGCRPEGNNRDICRLLTLQKHFDRDIILDPAFATISGSRNSSGGWMIA